MRELLIVKRVNIEALHEQLAAAYPCVIGLSSGPGGVRLHLTDDATDVDLVEIDAFVEAHDPAAQSETQIARARAAQVKAGAKTAARNIPNWATWDRERALSHIQDNVTDLASAKQLLLKMAEMLVAIRNELWPDLEEAQKIE